MDVLTSETCWVLNNEIIKQVTSSSSLFIQVPQLAKKFPTFYGIQRFITAFTSARYLSLSWVKSIWSITSHSTSWRYILILSCNLCPGLPNGLFPSRLSTKTLYAPILSPVRAMCRAHPILSELITWITFGEHYTGRSQSSPLRSLLHSLVIKCNISFKTAKSTYATPSRDASVGTAMSYSGWTFRASITERGKKFFFFSKTYLWGPRSPLFGWSRGSFLGAKRPGCDGD